jgi:drug/metabolite transporter (DMT)-like permease
MIYLIFSILSSVLVAVIIRLNEARNLNRAGVMLFNYITAAAIGILLTNELPSLKTFSILLPLGSFTGFIYVATFFVYMYSVRQMGMAIPVTVTRLSVVVPVLGSVIIFSEAITSIQSLGILMALISIFLFSWNDKKVKANTDRKEFYLPILLFLMMGSGDFSLKVFQGIYPADYLMSFIILVFVISSILSLFLVLVRRVKISRQIIIAGFLLGIPNYFSAYFILKTLQRLSGAITFTLNNIGIIMLSTFLGFIIWREPLKRKAIFAIAFAIISVILLNI